MKSISRFQVLYLFAILIVVSPTAFAQTRAETQAPGTPIGGYRTPSEDPNQGRRQNDIYLRESQRRLDMGTLRSNGSVRDSGSARPAFIYKSESKLSAKEKMLLATHPEDEAKYAEFLRQPGTGLFRLLTRESKGVVTVETLKNGDGILPIRGGGSYYSYSKLRHDLDEWAELGLVNETFQVGFVPKSLGLMGLLGDVPLENVNLNSKEVAYLHELVPPTTYEEMEWQSENNIRQLRANGISYSSLLSQRVGNTYVLRSTIYGKADILVAFRVIREDADGSVHILWKKLTSYEVPNLKGKQRRSSP